MVDGKLFCIEFATGKFKWEGGKFAGGNAGSAIVTGDDKVIVWGGAKLALVETAGNSPDGYKELAVTKAQPDTYPYVMLAEGWILVKDETGKLAACSVGPPAPAKP